MDQIPKVQQDEELDRGMNFIRHGALHNLTVDELGVMLKRHAQIIL